MSTSTIVHHLAPAHKRRLPAPMRILRTLCSRLIAADGPRLETEILHEEIARETTAVTAATTEAQQAEQRLERLARDVKAFMSDPRTPGYIDPRESRLLAQDVTALKLPAHRHTESLRALIS